MQHVRRETQFTKGGSVDDRRLYGNHEATNTNTRPIFVNSLFPSGAVARIYRPARSAMTSGQAQTRTWEAALRAPLAAVHRTADGMDRGR